MIVNSDALSHLAMMEDNSVHCCVTSPPYYGLRDYKVDGQIGLEKTPEEYVARLVEIFRELRRVLRDDGTFWLNIGDSYSGSMSSKGAVVNKNSMSAGTGQDTGYRDKPLGIVQGYKAKDLMGIPWLLAFALRKDGWYLRADLPWIKRNSMPSSVTDRPASSIEHVFLFSKSKKYYYDHVATMQPSSDSTKQRDKIPRGRKQNGGGSAESMQGIPYTTELGNMQSSPNGLRFMRDSDFFFRTWQGLMHNEDGEPMALVVNPRGYKGAHFACFPVQLVEPMILAGTSEKGVCPVCGAPWVRDTEKGKFTCQSWGEHPKIQEAQGGVGATSCFRSGGTQEIVTIGWHPTCSCNIEPVPATVLDPFAGSCANGVACQWHNRNFIGIELKPDYCILAEKRLQENK